MSTQEALRASVLIPSFCRHEQLRRCLLALQRQTRPADEIFLVWQADDHATREVGESMLGKLPALRLLHSPARGVVQAENVALDAASGTVIVMTDDDALPPLDWISRHLAHYEDPTVGAVGGPADNFHPDGRRFPRRDNEPVGILSRNGRTIGNMYDQPIAWRRRPPRDVDHLVGYNMSVRRRAFDRFDESFRSYWQMFELDVCLQVRAAGYRVLFDFANVVEHWPTNTAYTSGRAGDLTIKCVNPAFNHGLVLAKHTHGRLLRMRRLAHLLTVGTTSSPALATLPIATYRYGNPLRELQLLAACAAARIKGWRAGTRAAVGCGHQLLPDPAEESYSTSR